MDIATFAEQLYLYASEGVTAAALVVAFVSLVARLRGMRRGVLVSRPAALYGMLGTIGALMAFYVLYAVTGEPASIVARGGAVRFLLINHSLALLHWNLDYVRLAVRGWRSDGGF